MFWPYGHSVVGETCTLLVARKRPHLVTNFLDYVDRSAALLVRRTRDIRSWTA